MVPVLLSLLGMSWGGTQGPADTRAMMTVEELPRVAELPDPFLMNDGTRVKTVQDWRRRRKEIMELLLHYQYGHVPPPPEEVHVEEISLETVLDGRATAKRVALHFGPAREVRVEVGLFVPHAKPGPHPVILAIQPMWLEHVQPAVSHIIDAGYLCVGFDRHGFDKDDADRSDGMHPLYPDYDWATLAVWAWGALRVVDYVQTLEEVDPSRIALTGHSRAGKTALLAAALDERIALVAPHASGAGGAGCYRILGEGAESLDAITDPKRFHYWFQPRLREFVGKEDRLPFDQHFLKALIAPRALFSFEGLDDKWANPLGTQQTYLAAQPVFDFLGAGDKNALYFRPGGHDLTLEDWDALVEFADYVFFGKPMKTKFNELPFPEAERAFSWTRPE